jgi:glycine oxidase
VKVIVVGAGIVGCAIAYELASRGAAVSVVDQRGVAEGATHASAGILAPRIEGHSLALLSITRRSLEMYDRFVARVAADAMRPVEYERTGTLQVALNAAEARDLGRAAERLLAEHVPHLFAAGREATAVEPALAPGIEAVLLIPEHGYTAVGALAEALHAAAMRHGVAFESARVEAIRAGGAGPRVVAGGAPLEADAVVVAAGSWTSELAGTALHPAPVRPIRGQLLHLRTADRIASRVIWGTRCYLVPWRDGSVLVGATMEDVGFDERATVGGVRHLLHSAVELVPALAEATFEEVRVGLRPMTSDELPLIGASATVRGVFYAAGHYRNGVLLAPLTAALIADLVLDGREDADLELMRPARLGL